MSDSPKVEYGVLYTGEDGELHTEWGYDRSPESQIDKDGEINIGKRTWVTALMVFRRPEAVAVVVWRGKDELSQILYKELEDVNEDA